MQVIKAGLQYTSPQNMDILIFDMVRLLVDLGAELADPTIECDHCNVESLLGWGVDINSRDIGDQTPIVRAACKGIADVICLLVERGAEVHL